MYGISQQSKEQIDKVVEDLFDKAALRFLGAIPRLQHKKTVLIGFEQSFNLANLFVQSMNNKWLNNIENEILKGVLSGAANYIDILKNKTSNNILQKLEGIARQARTGNEKIPETEVNKIVEEELGKANSDLETIVMSESTKARNLGMVMDISRAAATSENVADRDPIVGFAGINDDQTCKECKRLFLMQDGVTPRLWRLSECSGGYFKRGDSFPSILGLHPRCRHTPFMVPSDWGFDKSGHLAFIGIGYNALEEQRSKT